ncbi:MAG TPA: hypothetical protein VGB14_01015 [Acidimicrobiales bacterium]|jgi:hypothetical protein
MSDAPTGPVAPAVPPAGQATAAPAGAAGEPAGHKTYLAYVEGLVKGQDERKGSIESRGLSVVTTSGVLVSLLFGLVALVSDAEGFELPRRAHGPLAVALVLFVVSAVLALLTNLPLLYRNVTEEGLNTVLDRCSNDDERAANVRVASTLVTVFGRARAVNSVKGWLLVAAMVFEVAAVVCVAVAVGEILRAA